MRRRSPNLAAFVTAAAESGLWFPTLAAKKRGQDGAPGGFAHEKFAYEYCARDGGNYMQEAFSKP